MFWVILPKPQCRWKREYHFCDEVGMIAAMEGCCPAPNMPPGTEALKVRMRLCVSILFLLASSAAFGSIGSDQPKQVQCGDVADGAWQNPCPAMGPTPAVTAGGLDTSGTSGAYVDVKWTTEHCSSSVVVLMRDGNLAPERQVYGDGLGSDDCGAGFAKNHLVHVDHLSPSYQGTPAAGFEFGSKGSHFFYVASQDKNSGKWSTSGGPAIASGGCKGTCKPFVFTSPVPNLSGHPNWAIWTYGPQTVYQKHDLMIGLQQVLTSGPISKSVYMAWSSVQFAELKDAAGNACQSNCIDGQDGTLFNMDVTLLCTQQYVDNPATEYANYMVDGRHRRDWCHGGNFETITGQSTIRIRTNCNGHGPDTCGRNTTPAGQYQVSATFQLLDENNSGESVGQPVTVSYVFTVRPSATFTVTHPSCLISGTCQAIPCYLASSKICPSGKDYTWENRIQYWGPIACTGGAQTFMARLGGEYLNNAGYFENGVYGGASANSNCYNYDNGRNFLALSDYADLKGWSTPPGASTQPNGQRYSSAQTYYQHCALVCQQSYWNFFAGVGAAGTVWPGGLLREWNLFPNGAAMYYFRSGDEVAKQAAINFGSYQPPGGGKAGDTLYQYYFVDAYGGARVGAYMLDAAVAKWQVVGSQIPQDALQTKRYVDSLLGILDQNVNYDPAGRHYDTPTHPQTYPMGPIWRSFMLGLDMEALIEYYDWQGAVGQQQDQRIPIAIKSTLDFMWSTLWAAKSSGFNAFYYNGVDIPHNSANGNDSYAELNNLVCGAYAWYWSMSGDSTYLNEGDTCFDAGISPAASVYFTGKDFGQIFKWTFDYIGWRTQAGYIPSTFPEKNRPSGAQASFPDTVPPVPRPQVGNSTTVDPYTGVTPVTVNGTSVTIAWSTYEQLSSAEVLYGFSNSYGSIAKGASKPCSSVSACNMGCASTVNPKVCRLSYVNTVVMTGLRPNATYHFATKGVDHAGNVAQTNRAGGTARDWTFTTGSQ